MGDKFSRREFLRRAVATGAAVAGASAVSGIGDAVFASPASSRSKSTVVQVTHAACISSDGSLSRPALASMLDEGLCNLTKPRASVDAWSRLFSSSDIVGIKVNCLFGPGASTHPELVDVIVAGLISSGVSSSNIIIYDRGLSDLRKSGFTNVQKARCRASDSGWGDQITQGAFRGRLTTILNDITALINVPILKTHRISGITCALQNHYGSISNPGQYHDNACDPYLADINSLPAIKDKTRLVIVDAVRPIADGGPGLANPDAAWNQHSLLIASDPVAADYVGWQIIEERRKETGLRCLPEPASWLSTATSRGLGKSDPAMIDLVRI